VLVTLCLLTGSLGAPVDAERDGIAGEIFGIPDPRVSADEPGIGRAEGSGPSNLRSNGGFAAAIESWGRFRRGP
jgi:hypothetical protein